MLATQYGYWELNPDLCKGSKQFQQGTIFSSLRFILRQLLSLNLELTLLAKLAAQPTPGIHLSRHPSAMFIGRISTPVSQVGAADPNAGPRAGMANVLSTEPLPSPQDCLLLNSNSASRWLTLKFFLHPSQGSGFI